ncbi:MAG: DUF3078 domain-containing protein [Paraprevotella sp.]|nr:DUF3078 domain-containing protein [Paraprevotella sp.]
MQKYNALLNALVLKMNGTSTDSTVKFTPYYYRLFAPGTLYKAPLTQTFGIVWSPSFPGSTEDVPASFERGDSCISILSEENGIFMRAYVETPQLIHATEDDLNQAGGLPKDVLPELPPVTHLVENDVNVDFTPEVDPVRLVVRRPNFWRFKGDYSFQLTQNYFSENWYQGENNNYTMLALVSMEANFNNKQKIQWDNHLEMRLGFQTSKTDEVHKVKTNDDLLRFTTKIGYKATQYWFYTLQVQAYTQFYPTYNANSNVVASDFMSPFNLVVSLGMDYKLELAHFKGSANLSPIAYNFRSVSRPSLFGNFGLEAEKGIYNNFGPNITVNYSWEIWKNVKWDARIYWFSNLKTTDIEWENTFTFTINKFLNSKLFLYPRIDDSSESYRSEGKGSYFMFKEWFSLGVNYAF